MTVIIARIPVRVCAHIVTLPYGIAVAQIAITKKNAGRKKVSFFFMWNFVLGFSVIFEKLFFSKSCVPTTQGRWGRVMLLFSFVAQGCLGLIRLWHLHLGSICYGFFHSNIARSRHLRVGCLHYLARPRAGGLLFLLGVLQIVSRLLLGLRSCG